MVRRSYYQGMDYRTDRQRSSDRGGHGEIPASLRGSGIAAQFAGNGGDTMTQFGFPLGGDLVDGDRYVTWDAAYVLGSLTSNERREYEAHLETCARCRSAVAEISGIPALLAMLDLEDVRALDEETPETPPLRPEVLESVLDKVRWRRRRSRWLTSAAVGVAAALLAVGVVIAIRPEIVGLENSSPQETAQALDDGQGLGNTDQRIDLADRLRLGHPHRHGLLVRRLGPERQHPSAEPGHGRGGPRWQPHPGRDVARAVRRYCVAERHTPRCRRTKSLRCNWFRPTTGRSCSKSSLCSGRRQRLLCRRAVRPGVAM